MDSYLAASAPQMLLALPVVSALLVQLIPSVIIAYVPASSTAARRIALLAVAILAATPFDALKPDYVPSQGNFIGGHLVRIAIALVVMNFFAHQIPQNVAVNYTFTKQHLAWRLAEVDAKELFLRVAGTIGFWVNMACYISTMYSCLAVVFVGLGLDTPADWPPVFGPISNGWTIQRFWGLTWHQTLRSLLSANCDYLLLSLLRLPRQSMMTRHARLGASFVLSGALHHIVDALVGVPIRESGMFKFFVMQWVGIMIEDILATLGRAVGEGRPGQKMRYMGYAWVLLWLVWTTPSVFYPYTRVTDGIRMDHSMLPRKLLRS